MGGYQNDPGTVQQEAGFGFLGRFWTESYTDNITALAGGARPAGNAALPSMFNRITTVANPGDSVLLPVGLAGLSVCIINASSNYTNVYAQGTDTINGVTGSVGVNQMGGSTVWYTCITPGVWTAQGLGTGQAGQYPTFSTQTGITASATQTQAAGTPLTAVQVQISVCAAIGNAVTLMPAMAGMEITIVNNGANAANCFPASQAQGGVTGGDRILPGAQNAALSLAAASVTIFYCFVTGTWTTK